MPVPPVDAFELPLLKRIADGAEHTLKDVRELVADDLGLSSEDRSQMLAGSSQPKYVNSIAWAAIHLVNTGLASRPAPGLIRITARGKDALDALGGAPTDAEAAVWGEGVDQEPSQQDCLAVLEFLPLFEQPGFNFGRMVESHGQMPFSDLSPESSRFMKSLYDHHFVLQHFEWARWQRQAEAYFREPSSLNGADLGTLQKLLTLHARADRFSEGHFLETLQSGHITAILRRLRELVAGSGISPRPHVSPHSRPK